MTTSRARVAALEPLGQAGFVKDMAARQEVHRFALSPEIILAHHTHAAARQLVRQKFCRLLFRGAGSSPAGGGGMKCWFDYACIATVEKRFVPRSALKELEQRSGPRCLHALLHVLSTRSAYTKVTRCAETVEIITSLARGLVCKNRHVQTLITNQATGWRLIADVSTLGPTRNRIRISKL